MKKVSESLRIPTLCITFAAEIEQNVSKFEDNMTHCKLQASGGNTQGFTSRNMNTTLAAWAWW